MSGMEHLEFYGPRCDKCGEEVKFSQDSHFYLGRLICRVCWEMYFARYADVLPGSPEPKRKTNEEEK